MRIRRNKAKVPVGRQRQPGGDRGRPAAFSYHAARAESPANTGRELGRDGTHPRPGVLESVLQRIGLIVLGTVIVAVVVSNLALTSVPRVIAAQSGKQYFLHSMNDYREAIGGILKQSIWNSTKLTISTDSVARQIKRQFPELASVSVTLPLLGHRPVVYISANQPALIMNGASGSFVLDNSGTAVLPTTQLPAERRLALPVVTDQTGLKTAAGRQVLTTDNVVFIREVIAQLKARGITPSALILPPAASELDVTPAGQSYIVKFNMHAGSGDARQQAGTFLAVQHKLASEGITPAKYIDVRVDGRAYYQ